MKVLDINGVAVLWQKIKNTFVAIEEGKGLSTNDYTNEEKEKLTNLPAGAEENVIVGITVNGTEIVPTERIVDIVVPTDNAELANGAGYQTAEDVAAAIDEINYVSATDGQLSDKTGNVMPKTEASLVAINDTTVADMLTTLTNQITALQAEVEELKAKVAYIGQ